MGEAAGGGASVFTNALSTGANMARNWNLDDQQTRFNNDLAQAGRAAGGRQNNYANRANEEYGHRTGSRDRLENEFWNLYGAAGEDGGGGGGGGYTNPSLTNPYANLTDPYQHAQANEGMEGYREFSKTGGWTPEQIAHAESTSTAAGRGIFAGLANALKRSGAGSGIPVYSGSMARLARDNAYGANEANANAMLGINQNIRTGRLAGLAGLSDLDTERLDRLEAARQGVDTNRLGSTNWENQRLTDEANRANAASAAAAGRGAAGRREQAGYLNDLMGLMGNDLPYWQLQEQAANNQTSNFSNQRTRG